MRTTSKLVPSSRVLRSSNRLRPEFECLEERTLLTVRSVIPLETPSNNTSTFHSLALALIANTTVAGDIVQIEPGSSPGPVFDSQLPRVPNFTIRGNPLFSATELPTISIRSAVTIIANQAGFSLQNIGVVNFAGTFTFQANGSFRNVLFENQFGGVAIHLEATSAASIVNSKIISFAGGNTAQPILQVTTAASANNLIQGNFISNEPSNTQVPVISYTGANAITDKVEHNIMFGNGAIGIAVLAGVDGLTIQDSELTTPNGGGIVVSAGAKNITIRRNSIDSKGGTTGSGVRVDLANATSTSFTIVNNNFTAGTGRGIAVIGTAGTVSGLIEGNEFFGSQIGVFIDFNASGVDLGGGARASKGGNNFRGFTVAASATSGAIVTGPTVSSAAYTAQGNLFGVANSETAIFDKNDDITRSDIVATSILSGNAAFVQALYIKFLQRAGDLANSNDAGAWVAALNGGASTTAVANSIVRSGEAFGLVVDDLYRTFLRRAADSGGRSFFVGQLSAGVTVESVERIFLSSGEYLNLHLSDASYVQSLFLNLLGRLPANSEVSGFLPTPTGNNRDAIANVFLNAAEFRNREVSKLYNDILHRTASGGEVSSIAGTGLDIESIRVLFAASGEFFAAG